MFGLMPIYVFENLVTQLAYTMSHSNGLLSCSLGQTSTLHITKFSLRPYDELTMSTEIFTENQLTNCAHDKRSELLQSSNCASAIAKVMALTIGRTSFIQWKCIIR